MSFKKIYNLSPFKRTIIMWILFQVLLWSFFGISALLNQDAWINVIEVTPNTASVGGWLTTFLFIVGSNLLICLLIAIGNLFTRFGFITPGVIILALQVVSIGLVAGSNQFEVPFVSIAAANLAYLKIGLWETTAYALICAITMPKSLYIADTFPAKRWCTTKKISDIKLNKSEIVILIFGLFSLLASAIIETYSLL